MKILVISDSHNVVLDGQIEDIKKEGNFDLLIHCGDKYNDAEGIVFTWKGRRMKLTGSFSPINQALGVRFILEK